MSSPCVGIYVGIEVRRGGENATPDKCIAALFQRDGQVSSIPSHTTAARLMGRRAQ